MDAGMSERWEALNSAERWFSLLETWLLHADPSIAGEERVRELCTAVLGFTSSLFKHPRQRFPDRVSQERGLAYRPGFLNLALMELFGLLEIEHGKGARGQGWRVLSITLTPFGKSVLRSLAAISDDMPFTGGIYTGDSLESDPDLEEHGGLRRFFGATFPAWKQSLGLPTWPFQSGAFQFKVSLDPQLWRCFSVASETLWDEFSSAILDAFGFDHDHLYFFECRIPTGHRVRLHHSYLDEPHYADEVQVGAVPLSPGDRLVFIYDLGHQWRFDLELEAIGAEAGESDGIEVVASQGDNPDQYSYSGW